MTAFVNAKCLLGDESAFNHWEAMIWRGYQHNVVILPTPVCTKMFCKSFVELGCFVAIRWYYVYGFGCSAFKIRDTETSCYQSSDSWWCHISWWSQVNTAYGCQYGCHQQGVWWHHLKVKVTSEAKKRTFDQISKTNWNMDYESKYPMLCLRLAGSVY